MVMNAIGKGSLTWRMHDLPVAIVSWRYSSHISPERERATSNAFAGKAIIYTCTGPYTASLQGGLHFVEGRGGVEICLYYYVCK